MNRYSALAALTLLLSVPAIAAAEGMKVKDFDKGVITYTIGDKTVTLVPEKGKTPEIPAGAVVSCDGCSAKIEVAPGKTMLIRDGAKFEYTSKSVDGKDVPLLVNRGNTSLQVRAGNDKWTLTKDGAGVTIGDKITAAGGDVTAYSTTQLDAEQKAGMTETYSKTAPNPWLYASSAPPIPTTTQQDEQVEEEKGGIVSPSAP